MTDNLQKRLEALQISLHEEPELCLETPLSKKKVLDFLQESGVKFDEIKMSTKTSGFVAVMGFGEESERKAVVLLRSDMDALPMQEETGLSYSSKIPNRMHACGHDLHMSMLCGAASLLDKQREGLCGTVLFMFQPGEESPGGSPLMIEEGLLQHQGKYPDVAYALHVAPLLETGKFYAKPGAMMAGRTTLKIRVIGNGTHGSAPQNGNDPVPVAAQLVLAIQAMITRRFDVFDPVIASCGSIHGGQTANVIPNEVELLYTIRSFSIKGKDNIRARIEALTEGIAKAHGMTSEITEEGTGYPPAINDAQSTATFRQVVEELYGKEAYEQMPNSETASEDFAFVLQKIPGSFAYIGARPPHIPEHKAIGCHSTRMVCHPGILFDGSSLEAALVKKFLQKQ